MLEVIKGNFPDIMLKVITSHSLPKISVITIVRNGMPFVEQTIKSVIGQRNSNFEYIVIDGGSTDGTVDVIKSHELGIAKWVSEKDDGISDAFNKGLSFATGDYILFLNSDDALVNMHVLEVMSEKIVENEFPVLIYGDCDVLDRDSDTILYRAIIKFSRDSLRRGQMLPHPSLFANRSYFDCYGAFDPNFRIAMDYEWLLRGGFKERIVHVPLLVSNVRTGGISTLDQSKVVGEIISALKKNGHVSSRWSELEMRGYFFARSLIKTMLKSIGLYKLFAHLRNKRANPNDDELKNGSQDTRKC